MSTSTDFYNRAAAVLGVTGGTVDWPYEAAGMPLRGDVDYEERREQLMQTRQMMVEWAEFYGLRVSWAGCCPAWLLRSTSRRCTYGNCTGSAVDARWMDHKVAWLKDGRPAALTASPYGVSEEQEQRIVGWLQQHPELRAARGTGWYMPGSTTQIVLWNAARIDDLRPAGE